MRVLLDTNVLCRLAQRGHPHHSIALKAIDQLKLCRHELCLVPQIIYEYWVTITRPVAANGLGMSASDANRAVDLSLESFTLLRDERGVFSLWRELAKRLDIRGKSGHDARLVAAMQRHQIDRLITFNLADFRRYEGIDLLDPHAIAATTAHE